MTSLSFAIAFGAGIVSFFAPCILPIIPGFLAYLGGGSTAAPQARRAEIFINSIFFVLGFSLVFSVLGVLLNSVLGVPAYSLQVALSCIGGVIIIAFGLYLTGLLSIPFLDKEYKFSVSKKFSSRYLTSFLFGAAFAAGWTPCVGAVLGSILALAATQPGSAFGLLFSYSLGLGIPFLIVGLFTAQAQTFITRFARSFALLQKVFGVILIALGILVFTQRLGTIGSFELLNQFLLK